MSDLEYLPAFPDWRVGRRNAAPKRGSPQGFRLGARSTGQQEERGLSMPEQLREIRRYAETHGIEIVAEFQEAASAYRYQARRHEFHRMIDRARTDPDVSSDHRA